MPCSFAPYRLLYCAFVLCCGLTGFGQDYPFTHYTVEDGLASNTVYSAYCDSLGYMWFGTDKGLQRYDGHTFSPAMSGPLTKNLEVFEISEDYSRQVWLSTLYGDQYRLCGDSIVPFRFNNRIREQIGYATYANKFVPLENGSYHVEMPYSAEIIIDSLGSVIRPEAPAQQELLVIGKEVILSGRMIAPKKDPLGRHRFRVNIHGHDTIVPGSITFDKTYTHSHGDNYYVGIDQVLISITPERISRREFDKRIIDINHDREGNIWITFAHGGAISLKEERIGSGLSFLDRSSVTKVVQDLEGGRWFTTLYDGIFYVPTMDIDNYRSADGFTTNNVVSIDQLDEDIYLAFSHGDIYSMKNEFSFYSRLAPDLNSELTINDVYVDEAGHFYAVSGHNLLTDNANQVIKDNDIITHAYFTIGDETYGRGGSKLYRAQSGWNWTELLDLSSLRPELKSERKRPIICIAGSDQGALWIGADYGCFHFEDSVLKSVGEIDSILVNDKPTVMSCVDDVLYVGTENSGVLKYDQETNAILDMQSNLASDRIRSLYNDGDSLLWVGTDSGVSCIDIATGKVRFSLNRSSGLCSDKVNEVYADQESIYIATSQGLSVLKRGSMTDRPHVDTTLQYIKVNESRLAFGSHLALDHDQNELVIEFMSVGYKSRKRNYRYRLQDIDQKWTTTSSSSTNYSSLPSGDFTFTIQTANEFGQWSSPQSFTLTVEKPWYESLWFNTLILALVLLGLYLYRSLTVKRLKTRLRKENLQAYYKQQAIASRMDPHFIFNSLNSLSYFIAKNENDKANEYLTSFSRMLRNNIDYSKQDLISLQQEEEFILSYCKLEAMRLEGGFDFEMDITSVHDSEETLIPAMMLQPIVENSIWHGLAPKSSDRKLTMRVSETKGRITIDISDNGIGHVKSQSQKVESSLKRKRHAVDFIKGRLKLFTTIYKKPFTYTTSALSDDVDYPGTRTLIEVPKIDPTTKFS